MTTLADVRGRKLKDQPTDEELAKALKMPYDLTRPHKRIVGAEVTLIIQDGIVYAYGSGDKLGTTSSVLQPSKGVLMVKETGATFPDNPAGRYRMEKYMERNGLTKKEKGDGSKVELKESSIEERKAAVKEAKGK